MKHKATHYLVDIDNTLTACRPGAITRENTLHGNFLFPIFRDMLTEQGMGREEAEKIIGEYARENIFWDYPDFIAELSLPAPEAFRRMRQWHAENLFPLKGNIDFVRSLADEGRSIFIMSNNPHVGCLMKLQVAGLAGEDFALGCVKRVFGTNLLRGCKSDAAVWKRALAQIPAPPSEIGVIGDDPVEDGQIPKSLGVGEVILL